MSKLNVILSKSNGFFSKSNALLLIEYEVLVKEYAFLLIKYASNADALGAIAIISTHLAARGTAFYPTKRGLKPHTQRVACFVFGVVPTLKLQMSVHLPGGKSRESSLDDGSWQS
ncbi:hypothetical protein [Nostoc sp. MG11]|uniref:hypothetical protein n=1 Tax=Nostoc sp. MG11 TaxID=2721166 RepID=UPI001867734A|nr:hypothetical protein [Nostoc sp. MG11]